MSYDAKSLEKGATVVVAFQSSGPTTRAVGEVVKVTATQLVVEVRRSQYRFRRADGREVGRDGLWNWRTLEEATPEHVARVREASERADLVGRFRGTKWEALPLDTLRAIAVLLDDGQAATFAAGALEEKARQA